MYTSLFYSPATMLLVLQDGWTALVMASFYGHTDIVKLLLKAGADTEATTNAVRRTYLCSATLYIFGAVCFSESHVEFASNPVVSARLYSAHGRL